jgi:hypothetical protein
MARSYPLASLPRHVPSPVLAPGFGTIRRKLLSSTQNSNILPKLGLRQANLLPEIETRRCESIMAIDTHGISTSGNIISR